MALTDLNRFPLVGLAAISAAVLAAAPAIAADALQAVQVAPPDAATAAFRAGRKATMARLAPLRQGPGFAPLKAEFESAAAISDDAARAAALRAVIAKASSRQAEPVKAQGGRLPAPLQVTEESADIAHALPASSLSIHPSTFDQPSGTKSDCKDASDTFSFPGGDPFVTALSTAIPGDNDCDQVTATKFGGKVSVPAGTRTLTVTAQLDYTLHADTYAYGSLAWSFAKVTLIAMSSSIRFGKDGRMVGDLSTVSCAPAAVHSHTEGVQYQESRSSKVNRRIACTFDVASGSGEVLFGLGVRAGVDADITATARAHAHLQKIRGVQVVLGR